MPQRSYAYTAAPGLRGIDGGAAPGAALLDGARVVANAMDALSIAAFVCDAEACILASSSLAAELIARGEHVRSLGGRLHACSRSDERALSAAIRAASAERPGARSRPPMILVLQGEAGLDPLLLEITNVPLTGRGGEPAVAALLLARPGGGAAARAALLGRALFGLTQAETAVLTELLGGHGPRAIAQRAGVSVGTVRTHIRHLFEKAGVRSQLELLSRLTARL